MVQALLGKKIEQSQRFLEDGTRIPVTVIDSSSNVLLQIKTTAKEGYDAFQLGFGTRKKATKALLGHIKKAGLEKTARFFQEIRADTADQETLSPGSTVHASDVFKPGDMVKVTGTSKGKGFAGVVKRYHFKGGPRTHGQSDRERAPGSIGQTTTPGRVYKGKRMAGGMGKERVTVDNLQVVDVVKDTLILKGLVPGGVNSVVMIKKIGESKKFIPLHKEEKQDLGEENAN